jgi:hypothetical protein
MIASCGSSLVPTTTTTTTTPQGTVGTFHQNIKINVFD